MVGLNEVRDGVMTTALVLEMLASDQKNTFSKLIQTLPRIFQFKVKIFMSINKSCVPGHE